MKYNVQCQWTQSIWIEVESDTEEDAKKRAFYDTADLDIDKVESEYVEDSFEYTIWDADGNLIEVD